MAIGVFVGSLLAAAVQAGAQPAPPAPSKTQAILDRLVVVPHPASYVVVGGGVTTKPKLRDDKTVQGGKALRIIVPAAGPQPWAVNATNPLVKPVQAGDTLMLAFWARLAKGDGGAATAQVPTAAVQITKEPYTAVIGGSVTVGPEWKLHEIKGRIDKDYAPGDLSVSIHLATGRQTIDLGPIFVLDMGSDAG